MTDTNTTAALDIEYRKVIPARFVTKRDGTPMACMTCGTTLVMGSTHAATHGTEWHSYCARCAASPQAQIAGLVQRIETLVTPLGTNVPVEVTQVVGQATPLVEAVLAGDTGKFLPAKKLLLAVRTLIGAAKAAAAPTAAAQAHRSNAYGGKCHTCGVWIDAQQGRIEKVGGRWQVFHVGTCPPKPVATPQPTVAEGLYIGDDDKVRKVYMTRNQRLAVKVLVPQWTGEYNDDGSQKMRGSFQYVPGGMRAVAEGVAKGTIRLVTEAEAQAFGRQFSFCINCGLFLDDDRSLAAGYGPKCASNKGWWYPTYEEAAKILGRPAGPKGKTTAGERFAAQAEGTDAIVPEVEVEVTRICEYCDEVLTLRPVFIEASSDWIDMPVDHTGSEVCSGDDAHGPDYRHSPLLPE